VLHVFGLVLPLILRSSRKQLEPEKVRGMPLCMDSYKWLSVSRLRL
jgi:hypothetical protein